MIHKIIPYTTLADNPVSQYRAGLVAPGCISLASACSEGSLILPGLLSPQNQKGGFAGAPGTPPPGYTCWMIHKIIPYTTLADTP